jgi:MYXO-CTERM domain-containing protein
MFRLAVVLIVFAAHAAHAAQWHVDASAGGSGDGSAGNPFDKLGKVLPVLKRGDIVLVRSGTYYETVAIYKIPPGSGGRTLIKAAPGHKPIFDGGGSSTYVLEASEVPLVTFEGLTVRNATGSGLLFHKAHDGQVINCTTQNVKTGVVFFFSDRGEVRGSDLFGGVSGKASDGTVIRESTIHGSKENGLYLHADSKNCKYIANVVRDNTPINIYIDSSSNMTVDRNLIYMSTAPPSGHVGIQLADEKYANVTSPRLQNIAITNNVLVRNGFGVSFWKGSFPGQSGMKNVKIANNTIVNHAEVALSWDDGPHSAQIRNNIIVDDGKGNAVALLLAKSTQGVTLDHNLWQMPWINDFISWGGKSYTHYAWKQATGQGAGDLEADPKLVGAWTPPAANFRLQPGSPAVDKGAPLPYVTHDLDGKPRPAGTTHDIGAFETGGPAPKPDGGPPKPDAAPPKDTGTQPAGDTGGGPKLDAGAPAAPDGPGFPQSRGTTGGCACALGNSVASEAWWPALALLALALRVRRSGAS